MSTEMSELVEPMLWGYRIPLSQHFPEGICHDGDGGYKVSGRDVMIK